MAGVAIAALLVTFVARKNPLMGWLAASRTTNICVYLSDLRFLRGWAVIPNSEFRIRAALLAAVRYFAAVGLSFICAYAIAFRLNR